MQSQVQSTKWHSAIDRPIAIDVLAAPDLEHACPTQEARTAKLINNEFSAGRKSRFYFWEISL